MTAGEEGELLRRFADLGMEPVVIHGVASRRQVRHLGLTYDFGSWATASAKPIPDYLLQLRAAAALVAPTEPAGLVEALVTRWLAADTVLRFQRRASGGERRVFEQPLARRSVYILAGAARSVWQLSIPAVTQERWSATFRQLRRTSSRSSARSFESAPQ